MFRYDFKKITKFVNVIWLDLDAKKFSRKKHMYNFMLKVYGKAEGHYTKTDSIVFLREQHNYYKNSG